LSWFTETFKSLFFFKFSRLSRPYFFIFLFYSFCNFSKSSMLNSSDLLILTSFFYIILICWF
jgi:hypothetical protein